ncbi:MAG: DUF4437 domain-containing protein [Chloroflexota bacterium]|nr:DUF4437 domain-containing protein [Dehalococcoidia bacterium]MDW8253900.1 DUF4437 domain-containing protein [Chloroflexota bacterium]
MTRPLIDFIHVDSLPWQQERSPSANQPHRYRRLSEDEETGEQTLLVELPAGWRMTDDGWLDVDDELFLLGGDLTLNGERLTKYSYLFIPAGQLRRGVRSEGGARLLQFRRAAAAFHPAAADSPQADLTRAIGPLNLRTMPYERPQTPNFPAGAGRKTLRRDPVMGDGFWVIALLPHWISPLTEKHTFSEENYVLEGEIETSVGVMTPGAYLHHPPGAVHGPMRSRPGCLIITRAGGPFHTDYEPVSGDYAFPEEV